VTRQEMVVEQLIYLLVASCASVGQNGQECRVHIRAESHGTIFTDLLEHVRLKVDLKTYQHPYICNKWLNIHTYLILFAISTTSTKQENGTYTIKQGYHNSSPTIILIAYSCTKHYSICTQKHGHSTACTIPPPNPFFVSCVHAHDIGWTAYTTCADVLQYIRPNTSNSIPTGYDHMNDY